MNLSERLSVLAELRRDAPVYEGAQVEAAWIEEAAEMARRVESGSVFVAEPTRPESIVHDDDSEFDFGWDVLDEALRAAGIKPGDKVRVIREEVES